MDRRWSSTPATTTKGVSLGTELPRENRHFSPSPGSARIALRDATAACHASVDQAYSHFDLSHRAGYGLFLRAHQACVGPLEAALDEAGATRLVPEWASQGRAHLLDADLADLGIDAGGWQPMTVVRPLGAPAAMLGALYVLEGSRFGGAVLARRVANGLPTRYLAAPSNPGLWRALISALDRELRTPQTMAAAIGAASAVFRMFEASVCLSEGAAVG